MRTWTRVFLVICLLLVAGAYALSHPLHDFLAYFVAAHLFVGGTDPYSLSAVAQQEKLFNWPEPVPLMALNPPWVLPLIAPLGFLNSYSLAWLLWSAML